MNPLKSSQIGRRYPMYKICDILNAYDKGFRDCAKAFAHAKGGSLIVRKNEYHLIDVEEHAEEIPGYSPPGYTERKREEE